MRTASKIAISVSVLGIVTIIGVIAYINNRNSVIAEETIRINRVIECIQEYGSFCNTICQTDSYRESNTGRVFQELPRNQCESYIKNIADTYL